MVVNTADDFDLWGLHICPDLDTVMYTLAGISDPETGWGIANESFETLSMLASYGEETWFKLGEAYLSNSVADEYAVWFLATGLVPGERQPEGTEVIGVRRVPVREAVAMAMDGRITDALSTLALTTYALKRCDVAAG